MFFFSSAIFQTSICSHTSDNKKRKQKANNLQLSKLPCGLLRGVELSNKWPELVHIQNRTPQPAAHRHFSTSVSNHINTVANKLPLEWWYIIVRAMQMAIVLAGFVA